MFVSKDLRPRINSIYLKCVNFSGGHPKRCRQDSREVEGALVLAASNTLFLSYAASLRFPHSVLGKAKLQVALPSRTKRSALHLLEKLRRYAEEK